MIKLVPKGIEGSLLRREGGAGWPNGAGLERFVHPLVSPVLLRSRCSMGAVSSQGIDQPPVGRPA